MSQKYQFFVVHYIYVRNCFFASLIYILSTIADIINLIDYLEEVD